MNDTNEKPNVIELIARVMADVPVIEKKDTNSHFGFKFRGIDTTLDKAGPALRKHGVVTIPKLLSRTLEPAGKSFRAIVEVEYVFYGPRMDSVSAIVPGEALDAQDKATSKAMTVAHRTALLQVLSVATGEPDPDAGPKSTNLVKLQAKVKKIRADKGWTWEALGDDYAAWSQGEDIQHADEAALAEYVKYLDPGSVTTMQRKQGGQR